MVDGSPTLLKRCNMSALEPSSRGGHLPLQQWSPTLVMRSMRCADLFQANTDPPNSTLINVLLSNWLVESGVLVLGWNKTLYTM